MKGKERKALLLFMIAMILFSFRFSPVLTGNAIGNVLSKIPIFQVAGFIFITSSAITLIKK